MKGGPTQAKYELNYVRKPKEQSKLRPKGRGETEEDTSGLDDSHESGRRLKSMSDMKYNLTFLVFRAFMWFVNLLCIK
jgi:hypothetical protein